MTKKEVTQILIDKFINKYGNKEVKLNKPIQSGNVADYTDRRIKAVRQQSGVFEIYVDAWDYGWKNDKKLIAQYLMRVLADVLQIKVKESVSYTIE